MTTERLLVAARTPGHDLYGRMELVQEMMEDFVREAVKFPADLTFSQALILARMAKNPEAPVITGKIKTEGYYVGSNPSYNVKKLVELQFLKSAGAAGDRRRKLLTLTKAGREFGTNVAMQVDFIERQIGTVFSEKEYRTTRSFLGETVHGGEAVRPREIEHA